MGMPFLDDYRRSDRQAALDAQLICAPAQCIVIESEMTREQADVNRNKVRSVTIVTEPVGAFVQNHRARTGPAWQFDHSPGTASMSPASTVGDLRWSPAELPKSRLFPRAEDAVNESAAIGQWQ